MLKVLLFFLISFAYSSGCKANNCAECTNDETLNCFWCFSKNKCMSVNSEEQCEHKNEFEESCSDIVFKNCQKNGNCGECTNDPNCLWIEKGNFIVTQNGETHREDLTNGTCWNSILLASWPKFTEVHKFGNSYKLQVTTMMTYYLQCGFSQWLYWLIAFGVLISAFLIIFCLGCICGEFCMCCCCIRCLKNGKKDDDFSINSSSTKGYHALSD